MPADTARARQPAHRRSLKAANPVLVVDDDALNREMLSALLRRNGLEVIEAEDGLSALDVLEQQPIDLVLLDVMMPKLDGYGVLQRMNANPAAAGRAGAGDLRAQRNRERGALHRDRGRPTT